MPERYAAKLAEHLVANADENPYVVDVPNDGFNLAVGIALENLGYRVERHPFKPRLSIYQKEAVAEAVAMPDERAAKLVKHVDDLTFTKSILFHVPGAELRKLVIAALNAKGYRVESVSEDESMLTVHPKSEQP